MTKRAAWGARAPKTYSRLFGGRYGLSSSSALAAALHGSGKAVDTTSQKELNQLLQALGTQKAIR